MRDVERGPMPRSLADNATTWTEDLLAAHAAHQRDPSQKIPDGIRNRYNQPDVRRALVEMYSGCCCYCDASVGEVAHEHIEHRKPKSKFPQLAFQWDNLHLSCPKCNMAKGDEYDDDQPILDPVQDHPVSAHLSYEEPETGDDGVLCKALTERGATTIDHTDLDRGKLRRRRLDVYLKTVKVTNRINQDRQHPNVRFVKRNLEEKTRSQFGSVIAFVIQVTGI